jgi:hypothetical protein
MAAFDDAETNGPNTSRKDILQDSANSRWSMWHVGIGLVLVKKSIYFYNIYSKFIWNMSVDIIFLCAQ